VQAAAVPQMAASLGQEHVETHLNLALVYERQNRLPEALREITISRRLVPEDPDARKANALICAEINDLSCVNEIWIELIRTAPDYAPARRNIAILHGRTTLIRQWQNRDLSDSPSRVAAGQIVSGLLQNGSVTRVSR